MSIEKQIKNIDRILNTNKKYWTFCEVCGSQYIDLGIGDVCHTCLEAQNASSEVDDNLDDDFHSEDDNLILDGRLCEAEDY